MLQEKSFSVYEPYAANFNSALELAQAEADKLAQMPHPVYEQLQAFLIKPVQRITKYPLLLKDLIKYSDPITVENQQLEPGLEAIQRIATATNEAIRKSENMEIVKDLEGRVEDWKGHKLEHFGELLLHGQFSVIKGDTKGDVEREVGFLCAYVSREGYRADALDSTTFICLSAFCCAARRWARIRSRGRRCRWQRARGVFRRRKGILRCS